MPAAAGSRGLSGDWNAKPASRTPCACFRSSGSSLRKPRAPNCRPLRELHPGRFCLSGSPATRSQYICRQIQLAWMFVSGV